MNYETFNSIIKVHGTLLEFLYSRLAQAKAQLGIDPAARRSLENVYPASQEILSSLSHDQIEALVNNVISG